MKNILIAEDHPLVHLGIRIAVEEILPDAVFEKADSFPKALVYLEKQRFDLMIMDIHLPGGDNVGMVEAVRRKQPNLPILVNSSYDEQLYALPFLKAGANGYISKTASSEDFRTAIENVLSARIYASPQVLQNAFKKLFDKNEPSEDRPVGLTEKEHEIALLLLKGLTTKSIGELLHLSPSSVSNYKTKIFEKCGVDNVIDLGTFIQLNANRTE